MKDISLWELQGNLSNEVESNYVGHILRKSYMCTKLHVEKYKGRHRNSDRIIFTHSCKL